MNRGKSFAGLIVVFLAGCGLAPLPACGSQSPPASAETNKVSDDHREGGLTGVFAIEAADGKCRITIDTSAAPELRDWADHKLAPVLAEWYPKIVALLPSDGFMAPTNYSITIRPGRGVAATWGTHITANSTWLRQEIGREAIGSLVHETVHVVQQYGRARRTNPHPAPSPGWLVEGIADYIRWFRYEPQSHGADLVWMRRRRITSPRYDAGYRVTANFLNWVAEKYDPNIITQLNAAMREGKYQDELWQQYTGRTVEQLGQEWQKYVAAGPRSARNPKKQQLGYS